MLLDKDKLLIWLDHKSAHSNVVVHAVYRGLAERIRHGEFDTEEND